MEEKKRRKAKKKRTIRPGCLISFLLIVTSFAIMFLTPLFNVSEITVTGNSRVSTETVIGASGVERGKNVFLVNTKNAESKLKSVQYVENARVKRKLPGKIEIKLTEGKVKAYINHGENLVGINLQGKTLCFIDKASKEGNIMVIYGLTVEENTTGKEVRVSQKKNYKTALELMSLFEKNKLIDSITHLDVSNNNDIAFRYKDNLKIKLGDMSDVEYKFAYLVEIIDSLGENPEGLINMQNTDNIAYRASIE